MPSLRSVVLSLLGLVSSTSASCGEPGRGAEPLQLLLGSERLGDAVLVQHPRVALTAAHILKNVSNVSALHVVAGGEERAVVTVRVHSAYHRRLLFYDAALLLLERPFTALQPLCLPDPDMDVDEDMVEFYNKSCSLVTSFPNMTAAEQKPLMGLNKCERELRRTALGNRFVLHRSFLCGPDPCSQPSRGGSGLVCRLGPQSESNFTRAAPARLVVVGLASWSVRDTCGAPGLFASTIALIRWINSTLTTLL